MFKGQIVNFKPHIVIFEPLVVSGQVDDSMSFLKGGSENCNLTTVVGQEEILYKKKYHPTSPHPLSNAHHGAKKCGPSPRTNSESPFYG